MKNPNDINDAVSEVINYAEIWQSSDDVCINKQNTATRKVGEAKSPCIVRSEGFKPVDLNRGDDTTLSDIAA